MGGDKMNFDLNGFKNAHSAGFLLLRRRLAYDAEGTSPRVATVTLTIPDTSASLTVTVKQNRAANA